MHYEPVNFIIIKQLLEGATRSHVFRHYAEVRRSAETITIDFNFLNARLSLLLQNPEEDLGERFDWQVPDGVSLFRGGAK
jgi:hypothetical protein